MAVYLLNTLVICLIRMAEMGRFELFSIQMSTAAKHQERIY
jgi:hypothetical protein